MLHLIHLHHAPISASRDSSLMDRELFESEIRAADSIPYTAGETEPEFLSRAEVARLFGVSLSTITRWARTGLIRASRTPGGHYRYRTEEVRLAVRAGDAAAKKLD
jgi:excisionase family DNA binding protein